jgi:hypothetical protein
LHILPAKSFTDFHRCFLPTPSRDWTSKTTASPFSFRPIAWLDVVSRLAWLLIKFIEHSVAREIVNKRMDTNWEVQQDATI